MLSAPPVWLYHWRPVQIFVARLRNVRADAFATSWWRDLAENRRVGGHSHSQHLLGTAADFVPSRGSNAELAAAIERVGLIAIDEGDHVHAQLYPAGALDYIVDAVRQWL